MRDGIPIDRPGVPGILPSLGIGESFRVDNEDTARGTVTRCEIFYHLFE